MIIFKQALRILSAALSIGVSAHAAVNYSENYKFTNKETWEVPEATLPPGDYVLSVKDKLLDREIFQVKGAKDGKVYCNFLAIRAKGENFKDVLTFWPAAGNAKPIRAWFISNEAEAWEFVYPKEHAIELAKASGASVPAVDLSAMPKPNNPLLSAEDLRAVQLWLLTPKRVGAGPEGIQIAAAKIGPKHPRLGAATSGQTPVMPRTASNFLEVLFAGGILIACGSFLLRRAFNQR